MEFTFGVSLFAVHLIEWLFQTTAKQVSIYFCSLHFSC